MLIKEYRIPLPMSVEEYRIAQLYMIQKKSRLESVGEGSGVEIIENRPYSNGPGGDGQYTKKIYHIGSHLPGWLKAILPKAALRVEEEAWNAYPYTKMRTTCPFVEKFFVDVETYYYPDGGQQENVFKLSSAEIQSREVDLIDPIKDSLFASDYLKEEDPLLYKSKKTGRGPMKESWLTEYQCDSPPSAVMCAYKLIKVEFRYWGMQSKIEHFIHGGLRRPMLLGHRQAWVWQDEWHGLTIEDIRNLEVETQKLLAKKMGRFRDSFASTDSDQEVGFASDNRRSIVSASDEATSSRMDLLLKKSMDEPEETLPDLFDESAGLQDLDSPTISSERNQDSAAGASGARERPVLPRISLQRDSISSFESYGGTFQTLKRFSGTDMIKEWRMTSIQTPESASDEEFFDAQEELDDSQADERSNLLRVRGEGFSSSFRGLELDTDSPHGSEESLDSIDFSLTDGQHKSPRGLRKQKLCKKVSDSSTCSMVTCQITNLVLVIHGGSQLNTSQDSVSKKMDSQLLFESFNAVINAHYRGALGRIAIKLVECPSICSKALSMLSQLCPYSESDSDCSSVSSGFTPISSSFPVGAVPLIVTSSLSYQEQVGAMVASANSVYQEFLRSEEGQGFRGEVTLVGDCMGAVLAYDALCYSPCNPHSRTQSLLSEYSTSSLSVPQPTSPAPATHISEPSVEPPRRTSSHVPPMTSNLEAAKSLRLSFSSGNIAENVRSQTCEGNRSPVDRDSPEIPSQSARRQNFSFETMSLSVESVDFVAFDFEVTKFFAFGSPIGLVIAYRRLLEEEDRMTVPLSRPLCNQVYNLFHPFDPAASRIEPLIIPQFSQIQPVNVPRYHRFPLGDAQSHLLHNTVGAYPELFLSQASPRLVVGGEGRMRFVQRDGKASPVSSNGSESPVPGEVDSAVNSWWGAKRLDFALYCPEGLQQFPTAVLSPLFHVSYWESSDVAAFVVREILHGEWDLVSLASPSKKGMTFTPTQPLEKWRKRRTYIKIKNLNANHRANDSVTMENSPQVITARFMYGPLDMVSLSGEKVDVYVMTKPPSGEYEFFESVITASGGRLSYVVPEQKKLPVGIYPIKIVVRGDHTCVDSNLAILPPKTEAVVFSIDGSFTTGVSLRGKDPKVRAGAVDVVRHWQELGFLIVYVTSRLDFQKHKVMTWLAEHNFPYGLVAFGDGISKELQKHKTEFLRCLKNDCQVIIQAAYGSAKDISVYASIGLQPHQIYTVGKHSTRKYEKQAQFLKEGYAAHLTALSSHPVSRFPVGNSRIILRRGCFGLPSRVGKSKGKVKRSHSDRPSVAGEKEKDTPISGSFNYSSFRHTKGRSVAKLEPDFSV